MTKKITKLGIEELRKILPELPRDEQRLLYGGYDSGDCWWRCVAYIQSFGTAYSAQDAMEIAMDYYGANFNSSEYTFAETLSEYRNYATNHLSGSGIMQGQIMIYDPNTMCGEWGGAGIPGERHAVIILGHSIEYVEVFDPQNNRRMQILRSDLETSSYCRVVNYGN